MNVLQTALPGVLLLEPKVFGDPRGFFLEAFNAKGFAEAGIPQLGPAAERIVQINHSRSRRGTLRGLHFQEPRAQGKLVWIVSGEVYDVVVDVRRGSPTFGRWVGFELSEANHRVMWVPPGFAHGFCVLSESADFLYACTEFYAPDCEHAVRWDDPAIGIEWPIGEPTLSDKDARAPLLADAPVLPDY